MSSSVGSAINVRRCAIESSATTLAAVKDHDARADALDRLQLVRAEQHDLAARGELLHQAAEDERRADVESGEWFVEQEQLGIMQQGGDQQHLLTHPFE